MKQEFLVKHQPTNSGEGYADYVLWDSDSDKPLAVIEAKKTSISADQGKTQAKIYADGIEKILELDLLFYLQMVMRFLSGMMHLDLG